jgi:hypothetical protein
LIVFTPAFFTDVTHRNNAAIYYMLLTIGRRFSISAFWWAASDSGVFGNAPGCQSRPVHS